MFASDRWIDIAIGAAIVILYMAMFGDKPGNTASTVFLILTGIVILTILVRNWQRKGINLVAQLKWIIPLSIIIAFVLWVTGSGEIYGRYDVNTTSKEQNVYIELYNSGKIRLHVDMGGSTFPVANRDGRYTYDKKSGKLNIRFNDGAPPYELPIKSVAGHWEIDNDGTLFEQNEKSQSWAEYKK